MIDRGLLIVGPYEAEAEAQGMRSREARNGKIRKVDWMPGHREVIMFSVLLIWVTKLMG